MLYEYQERIDKYRRDLLLMEQSNAAALTSDYDYLQGEIQRTRQQLKDEAQQLEASALLDLNLENKRRAEMRMELEARTADTETFIEKRASAITLNLKNVSRQALTTIGAIAATILSSFAAFKLLF